MFHSWWEGIFSPKEKLEYGELRFYEIAIVVYNVLNIVDISFVHPPIIGSGVFSILMGILECFPTTIVKTIKVKDHQVVDILEGSPPMDGTLYRLQFPPNVVVTDVVKTLYSSYSMLGYKTAVIQSDRIIGVPYNDEYALFD